MKEAGRSGLSSAARPTLAQNSTCPCTVRNSALAATRAAEISDSSMRMETVDMAYLLQITTIVVSHLKKFQSEYKKRLPRPQSTHLDRWWWPL